AERVRAAAATAAPGGGAEGRVSLSLGVAVGEAGASVEDLLAQADLALYEAKQAGRDRVCALDTRPRAVHRVA
ncbi:MAG: diguanylate cyclase domain-containing protein, partial [Acidimicrobiales bacterium]